MTPRVPRAAVLAHGDRLDAGPHPFAAEHAVQMIDLVRGESGRAVFEGCDPTRAVDVLVLDLNAPRSGDHAADVEVPNGEQNL